MTDLVWSKSTYCADRANCVEVAELPDGGRMVRDSQNPDGPALTFTRPEWDAFLAGAKDGEFDQGPAA